MPNGVAYGEFLKLLEATGRSTDPDTQDMYWHILADALGYDAHDDAAILGQRAALFQDDAQQISEERRQARQKVLCNPRRKDVRATEDLHNAVNSLSEITNAVKEQHYLVMRNLLTGAERRAFRKYLNKLKAQTTYTTHDSRIVNNPTLGGRDIRAAVRTACDGSP